MSFSFTLESTSSDGTQARTGRFVTPHGEVRTPVFMPVGTQASVKAVPPWDVKEIGAQIVLANAYHLYLRPGHGRVARLGGLHRFMGWDGPILTDSGGFQVFSLAHNRKVSDDGVVFRSHLDGSEHMLTPEQVMEIEQALGADIIMVLDEPAGYPSDYRHAQEATERTHRWAERCQAAHACSDQALFAIVQGGLFADLRRWSARELVAMDFPGYAIGGLSLGESKLEMWDAVEATVPELPANRPRYLMGVGSPEDLVEGVARGIDMFDCSFPTRIARNGALLTPEGRLNIRNARYKEQEAPVLDGCDCVACTRFSAAYIHHLFLAQELLAFQLATLHNLRFMVRLMDDMRAAVVSGAFPKFREDFLRRFQPVDPDVRAQQKAKWAQSRDKKLLDAVVAGDGAAEVED